MMFLNALEQARWQSRMWVCVLILALVTNSLTLLGWIHSQSNIRIEVPPHIPESGITLTQGSVPKTTVYSFAYYVWQSINHWSEDGLKDYKQHINQFTPFLTPSFKLRLIQNYNYLLNQGELQDRIRLIQGLSGSDYSPEDVRNIGHDTWLVHLKMRLTEIIGSNAKIVKDVQMDYTLKVVRYDVDAKLNPWGLAIAGFAESPSRIKTFI